jgi:hypothetical protein
MRATEGRRRARRFILPALFVIGLVSGVVRERPSGASTAILSGVLTGGSLVLVAALVGMMFRDGRTIFRIARKPAEWRNSVPGEARAAAGSGRPVASILPLIIAILIGAWVYRACSTAQRSANDLDDRNSRYQACTRDARHLYGPNSSLSDRPDLYLKANDRCQDFLDAPSP